MIPILYRTPWFFIYSYTAVFSLALIGSIWVHWRWHKNQFSFELWLVLILFGLVGGRIGFVLAQWDYFQQRPFTLWQGGFSYHFALLAVLTGLWIWCGWGKRPFVILTNTLAVPFALLTTMGWLACLLEGCGYGAETTPGWFAADLPDAFGVYAIRYQTQLFGILSSLIFFALTLHFKWSIWQLLFWISLSRMGIAQLRGDLVFAIRGIRIDILIELLLALVSLMLLQYHRYQYQKER